MFPRKCNYHSKWRKQKENFQGNFGHNIFELYNVLVEIPLSTSKPKCGIWNSKLNVRVVSRVAERPNT